MSNVTEVIAQARPCGCVWREAPTGADGTRYVFGVSVACPDESCAARAEWNALLRALA